MCGYFVFLVRERVKRNFQTAGNTQKNNIIIIILKAKPGLKVPCSFLVSAIGIFALRMYMRKLFYVLTVIISDFFMIYS